MAGVVRRTVSRGTRGDRSDDRTLGEPRTPFALSLQQWGDIVETLPHERTQDTGAWTAVSNLVCVRSETVAILLIAGDKTGDDRWYEVFVPRADDLYDEHLELLEEEGLI